MLWQSKDSAMILWVCSAWLAKLMLTQRDRGWPQSSRQLVQQYNCMCLKSIAPFIICASVVNRENLFLKKNPYSSMRRSQLYVFFLLLWLVLCWPTSFLFTANLTVRNKWPKNNSAQLFPNCSWGSLCETIPITTKECGFWERWKSRLRNPGCHPRLCEHAGTQKQLEFHTVTPRSTSVRVKITPLSSNFHMINIISSQLCYQSCLLISLFNNLY